MPISHERIYRHIYTDKRWVAIFIGICDVEKCNDPVIFCPGVIMRSKTREYGHGRRRKRYLAVGIEEAKLLVAGLFLKAQTILKSVVRFGIGRSTSLMASGTNKPSSFGLTAKADMLCWQR